MKRVITLSLLAVAAFTGLAAAQGPGGMGPRGGGPGLMGFMPHEKVVTGAPYSADVSNQMSQTLADGNTINHTTTGHVARDRDGRFYSQETISGGPFGNGPMTFVVIFDPVAGYAYRLNPTNKTALRHALPTPGTHPPGPPSGLRPSVDNSPNVTRADLGTQIINGISASGISRTRTIPAGAVGNAQPIVSTSETWTAPDLQVIVLAKRNDPRMGQSTYALTNIQKGQPPSTLFQVPGDYTITDAPAGPHHGEMGGMPGPMQP